MHYNVGNPCELKAFLVRKTALSSTKIKQLLDQRVVWVNNQRVWIAGYKLRKGDVVEVHGFKGKQEIQIVHQETTFLVINKPAGLLTNGESSAETILKKKFPTIEAVHRLDKDTSGLVIFAMNPETKEKFIEIFRQGKIHKTYRGIALGALREREQRISRPIEGQLAVTHIRVLRSNALASYVELEIPTGRKHQIRLHLNAIGHPIVGEKKYYADIVTDPKIRRIPRQMLHAYSLKFPHPDTQAELFLRAPEPADLKKALQELNLQKF